MSSIITGPEVPEITDRQARDKAIDVMLKDYNSLFYFEPMLLELEDIRRLVPTMPEAAFERFLATRHGRILCARCPKAARYWEHMKNDSFYKRALCTECMEFEAEKFYQRKLKRFVDPNAGHYLITALQARMKSKGLIIKKIEHEA
jgi:hypothetical protein